MLDLFLVSDGGLTLTEIGRRLGIPKSTAHEFLHTMARRGYVTCDPTAKTFSIGMRLIALARAAPIVQFLQASARPHLARLAADLGETAVLHVIEDGCVVAIDMVESPRSLRYSVKLGERWPLYATSAGKLYLAALSDDTVRDMYGSADLQRLTAGTIIDVDVLLTELAEVRLSGWARQHDEIIEDVSGFGAPVTALGGKLVASLTITGPSARIAAHKDAIVALLVDEADVLSAELRESH
jgi:DNA-binding IclR family transcriptional regulator